MSQQNRHIYKNIGTKESKRVEELDFLKCIMIILVIAFHLVYIGDSFPHAKQFVYTFHMPVFLMLSAFFLRTDQPTSRFMRSILFYAIPYIVMECGYISMASILPIREHINELTLEVFIDKLLLHPLGPYWYLHTLMVCGLTSFCVFQITRGKSLIQKYIIIGMVFFLLIKQEIIATQSAIYYLAGIIIRNSNTDIIELFKPCWLSLLALVALAINPANFETGSIGSFLIVYLAISLCLAIFPYIRGRVRRFALFLGRNTFSLYLFSPIFTILCKYMVNPLSFDPTIMLFLTISLAVCISGSLAISYMMDICKVSPVFFGRKKSLL